MADDKLTAALDEIRLRAENVRNLAELEDALDALAESVRRRAAEDAPRLLAALDRVLALADEWMLRPNDPNWARTRARDECATWLREAISAELCRETAPAGEGPQ